MHPVIKKDLKGVYTKLILEVSIARSNACWKCGGLGHFKKDYKAALSFQGGHRDDLACSDINPTVGQMGHTITTTMPITDFIFKVILKELISLAIGNRTTFHPKTQSTVKSISQPTMSGASPTAIPVMTAVTSTSLSQTTSLLVESTINLGNTLPPVNSGREPP